MIPDACCCRVCLHYQLTFLHLLSLYSRRRYFYRCIITGSGFHSIAEQSLLDISDL